MVSEPVIASANSIQVMMASCAEVETRTQHEQGRNSVPQSVPQLVTHIRAMFTRRHAQTGRKCSFAEHAKRPDFMGFRVVLPEGIELSTSPLPRECSTTELRQRLLRYRACTG